MKFVDYLEENTGNLTAEEHIAESRRSSTKVAEHMALAEKADGNKKIEHLNKAASHAMNAKNHMEKALNQ